mgnify:CR=1 FL=1
MRRDEFTLGLDLGRELIIDNFAGGGGTSTGLEAAFGRPVDIAINHDPEALAMHAMNHPHTLHLCESVWEVDPIAVTKNQPVGLVWLSPDCKHFSKAKGGTPVSKHIRGLAWVGLRWIAKTKPRVLMLENVEEFQDWGPLLVDADGNAKPDPSKKGKTFKSFVRQLRAHGYSVDWTELRACDHGAPTIRKRLFLVARRDGLPISFPEQTHAEPMDRRVLAGHLQAYRTAAECIDFELPAESVFSRKRPLVQNTMRRVAKGIFRHVLNTASPFIVNTRNGEREGQQPRIRDVSDPYWTVTSQGSQGAVAAPVLAPYLTEHANASKPKRPSTGITMGMVAAHLVDMGHGEGPNGGKRWSHGTRSIEMPLNTVTASGATSAVATAKLEQLSAACMEQAYGGFYDGDGRAVSDPMATITATGSQQRLINACLVKYYSEGGQDSSCTEPMHTVPTKDRMALVQTAKMPAANLDPTHAERARQCATLLQEHLPEQFSDPSEMVLMWHGSQWWVLVDITLRMLKPRELSRAQGFPESYHIEQIPDPAILFKNGQQAVGNPLSIPLIKLSTTAQVRMIGNSVSPPMAHALVMANFKHEARMYA